MGDRLEIAFLRAADATIPRGGRVLAGVSGGGDSVALLHLLHRASPRRGWDLTVAHLDHAMRPSSIRDRRFVERLARSLDLPCVADRRPVGALRARDESPEEAARRVRRSFLIETARAARCAVVALGHTLDDQAETVLLRLARGGGPLALAGMSPSGPGPFVRPLLGIEREEIRGWLRRRGFAWRDDPSNRDGRFDRNRLRRRVLPVLATVNPQAARHLAEAAARLRADATCLDALAAERAAELTVAAGEGTGLRAPDLAALPGPLGRRVALLALVRAGADRRRIGSRHLDALLALASKGGTGSLDLPSGLRATLRRGLLECRRCDSRAKS